MVMSLGSVEPPELEDFDESDVVPQAASARHAATVETPEMTAFMWDAPSTSVDPDGPSQKHTETAQSAHPPARECDSPVAESRKIDHQPRIVAVSRPNER
jgi:hypothetical protein